MNNKKEKMKYILIGILVLLIFSITVVNSNKQIQERIETSSTLSNKKIGWGIKRNDNHEQPDMGTENRKVLEENGGMCIGDSDKKYIYLTFDEGYEAGYTEKILDVLKQNDVKATFFITAHYLNTQEDLVKRMLEEGHEVGNHTPKCLMSGSIV